MLGQFQYERILPNLSVLLKSVQVFGFEIDVAAEHLSVTMAGDKGDAFDRQAGFKEAAGCLVPQVMKLEVFDIKMLTGAPKRGADGLRVIGKASTFAACQNLLLE